MNFFLGGTSAMCAGFFSNPFDVIKTRQQLAGELGKKSKSPYQGMFSSAKLIIKSEGIWSIQKGLGPALLFQFVMNSTRLGIYETVDNLNWTKLNPNNEERSMLLCVLWGGITGGIGSFVGCPLYLIKTQIQAQSPTDKFAVGFQHHPNTIKCLKRVFNESGIRGLWRGCGAIVPRTVIASSVQLTTFAMFKEMLLKYEIFKNSVFLTASVASMISGFFTVVAIAPLDVVTTRMFTQGIDKSGKGLLYKNVCDCFCKTYKYEGIKGFSKGFTTNYWRIAPHTLLNLTFWDIFKKWHHLYLDLF